MEIALAYPSLPGGGPRPLSRPRVAALAAEVRRKLFGAAPKPVEVGALARKTGRLRINGRPLNLCWDWEHAVHDPEGAPVLGCCEHDPAMPETVMISLNGEALGDSPEVLRSTAAHELGHAIFDMPAAIAAGRGRAFRLGQAEPRARRPIDWAEWRADEFMGEFLVPGAMLAKALAREAAEHSVGLRWRDRDGFARPSIHRPEPAALDSLTGALAERFGVSGAFMAVRLARNGFLPARGVGL